VEELAAAGGGDHGGAWRTHGGMGAGKPTERIAATTRGRMEMRRSVSVSDSTGRERSRSPWEDPGCPSATGGGVGAL
jgi:hypothetical protein